MGSKALKSVFFWPGMTMNNRSDIILKVVTALKKNEVGILKLCLDSFSPCKSSDYILPYLHRKVSFLKVGCDIFHSRQKQ